MHWFSKSLELNVKINSGELEKDSSKLKFILYSKESYEWLFSISLKVKLLDKEFIFKEIRHCNWLAFKKFRLASDS